jgi:D-alanyl-D-alanine carboxypeptidase/D-alanyl-D-alanine-endopeptidase (penicillin-binding protein 4)
MRSPNRRRLLAVVAALSLLAADGAIGSLSAQSAKAAGVANLRRDLSRTLSASSTDRAYWAVLAKSLKNGETLFALNPHKLMMPASTMKLATLAAAGEKLGWDFTFETRLLGAGRIDSGTLEGDLLVVGSGDPGIVERDGMAARLFESWAEQLKSAGVRTITGRVIGDDRAFDRERLGYGWSWDDLVQGFAAGVSALQYNENRVQVPVSPGEIVGAPAVVTLNPAGSDLVVSNQATTGAPRSPGTIEMRRLPGSTRLEFRGSIPAGTGQTMFSASIERPSLFFVTALRAALIEHGIEVGGAALEIGDVVDPPSAAGAVPLVTYRSAPLVELMKGPVIFSLNLHEETLLKTIGAAAGTPTFSGGRTIVRSVLQEWGIPSDEMIQVDGSGLSRYNYITADALVGILTHVARDAKSRGPFESLLPVAGRDGTLAARMRGTAAEGNARAKTGSMSNVRTIAGTVRSRDGEPIVFAILANNFEGPADIVTRTIDSIVVRLAEFSRK